MEIITAEFIKSSAFLKDCPPPTLPEYAFIGRSNVGKSSLINLLATRKSLAKVSNKPGKTRLINHFLMNQSWYLVDLPGYGYASIAKTERVKWEKMVKNYVSGRPSLMTLFILIDIRIPPQAIDLEFVNWVGSEGIPLTLVFTKADKIGKTKIHNQSAAFFEQLKDSWESLPPYIVSSAVSSHGKKEILDFIHQTNLLFVKTGTE